MFFSPGHDFGNFSWPAPPPTSGVPPGVNPDYFPEDYFLEDDATAAPAADDEAPPFGEFSEDDYVFAEASFRGDAWLQKMRQVGSLAKGSQPP